MTKGRGDNLTFLRISLHEFATFAYNVRNDV